MRRQFVKSALHVVAMTAIAAVVFLPGGCRGTEHTEAVTAEITAAQMEGRTAARDFIRQDWRDTSKVAQRLDTIERRKARFREEGRNDCAEAYDTAFVRALRAVKPDLGKAVDKCRTR